MTNPVYYPPLLSTYGNLAELTAPTHPRQAIKWDDPRADDIALEIKCTYCQDYGYVWVSETPDTGHDWQMNCPYCNPKIDLYAADRYEPEF